MGLSVGSDIVAGNVRVITTHGRGATPEEVAERALDKIIHVGDKSHPLLRDQAHAFQDNLRHLLVFYMYEAINSHNTTVSNRLREAGHPEIIPLLKP